MSKKQQQKNSVKPKPLATKPLLKSASFAEKVIWFLSDKRNQLLLIAGITLAFYGNSILNEYALDDGVFYTHNSFVQSGISGIGDIFTKESLYGFIGSDSKNTGGRWRPLSLITFALEKEWFGTAPHISHFVNVLLLALTGIVMLLFLRKYVFKESPLAAFITTLLFIIHPVHTEAVANIKSRDELMSWLFLVLTLYSSLNFITTKNYKQLWLSILYYFLALLSKENGISFIAILPLSFYFFTTEKLKTIVLATLPFIAVVVIYWLMRISFVPFVNNHITEVEDAPFLFATPAQQLATKLMVLGKYIVLLFWPNPLSADYSYNQVPYVTFSDWRVWLSIIVQAALLIYAVVKIRDKSLIAYGILFYFLSMFIVSNLVLDIGVLMAERFLYQASFGVCIAVVVAGNELLKKLNFKNISQKFTTASIVIVAVVLLSGFQTIQRNSEWKNDMTLWPADVKKVPNSARAQNGCAMSETLLIDGVTDTVAKMKLLKDAVIHAKLAHAIQPTYLQAWFNMGTAYYFMNNIDSTIYCWEQAKKLEPNNSMIKTKYFPELCVHFVNAGLAAASKKDYAMAKSNFYRALHYNNASAEAWYNLGGFYYTTANYDSARIAWQQCIKLDPDYTNAQNGLKALTSAKY